MPSASITVQTNVRHFFPASENQKIVWELGKQTDKFFLEECLKEPYVNITDEKITIGKHSGLPPETITPDTVRSSEDCTSFNFSCRSPFVLNSLFLSFPQLSLLPNLHTYLLDKHYKDSYQMICRVKEQMQETVPEDRIYYYCMNMMATSDKSFGSGEKGLFTKTIEEAYQNPHYTNMITLNVVKIKDDLSEEKKPGYYPGGWAGFYSDKKKRKLVDRKDTSSSSDEEKPVNPPKKPRRSERIAKLKFS